MGKQSKVHLKEKFNDGMKPTGSDFHDLIDSFVHQKDDQVQVDENGNVGIGYNDSLLFNRGDNYTALTIASVGGDNYSPTIELLGQADEDDTWIGSIYFGNDGNSNKKESAIIGAESWGSSPGDRGGKLHFWTKNDAGDLKTQMTILGNGDVGIGTTNPDDSLHVIRTNPDSRYVARFEGKMDTNCGLGVQIENETNHRPILELKSGTTPSTKLWVGGDGNIGIGTITPEAVTKLEVVGGWLRVRGANGTDKASRIGVGTNWWMSENTNGSFAIHQNAVGDRLTINDNGNVGIGITNPESPLHIKAKGMGWSGQVALEGCNGIGEWQILVDDGQSGNLRLRSSKTSIEALRLYQNGTVWAQSRAGGSADYAEYFESKTKKVIPDGTTVVMDQGKVRASKEGETPIGIISTSPVLLGNSPIEWPEKYLKDEFGRVLMEKPAGRKKGDKKEVAETPKLNPKYNVKKKYIPREDRPEWNCVGLLGQLPMRKGQPVAPSWVKIKDISKNVELWLVK